MLYFKMIVDMMLVQVVKTTTSPPSTHMFVEYYSRLLHTLLETGVYDHRAIPKEDRSPLTVEIDFSGEKTILNLNEQTQTLSLVSPITVKWRDYRLRWNPDDYGGVDLLHTESSLLWKPDIFISKYIGETGGYLTKMDPTSRIRIHHFGLVTWSLFVRLDTICPINTTFYPYDAQRCEILISSWVYSSKYLTLKWFDKNATVDIPALMTEWLVRNISTKRAYTYEDQFGSYRILVVDIQLSRRMSFTALAMIIPCLMLTVLTLVMFLLPPNSDGKLNLGVAIWTSLVVFLLLLVDVVPSSSDKMPLIGLYNIITLILVTLSLVLCVVSTKLYHSRSPVPKWLHMFAFYFLAKCVCWNKRPNNIMQEACPAHANNENHMVHTMEISLSQHELIAWKINNTNNGTTSTTAGCNGDGEWTEICQIFERLCFILQLVFMTASAVFMGVYSVH